MNIILKLFAAFLGYHFFGLAGAITAIIIVLLFESTKNKNRPHFSFHFINTVKAQQAFFNATFEVMGCIAKADGRVSEREIHAARLIMEQMGLGEAGKQRAIHAFTRGKQADFELADALEELKRRCHYPHLLKLFFDLQVQAAYAEGHLNSTKRSYLQEIAAQLHCPPIDFAAIEAAMRGEHRSGSAYQRPSNLNLEEAYAILGVAPDVSEAELKRAYRKLMNQHHPDKLVAKGLPEDMIKIATEKTQQIQKAYDIISKWKNQNHNRPT